MQRTSLSLLLSLPLRLRTCIALSRGKEDGKIRGEVIYNSTGELIMPTALELTREEWQPYIAAARRRISLPELTPYEQEKRERLLARAREAAAQLKTRFGVQKVVLLGSLASEEWFSLKSDVDLAVRGLKAVDYWEAWALVEEVIGDRPVDLIEIETARASLQRSIELFGLEL